MRLLFLFIGEPHQAYHALPIAAEMQRLFPAVTVECAFAAPEHLAAVERVKAAYPGFDPAVRVLRFGALSRLLRATGIARHPRLSLLVESLGWLRGFDAIIVPERTTTAIRHLLPRGTRLIFTPHGAGDRAIMLDPRDRFFDFVLVAGDKSERRLLDAGTIRPGHYAVNGYVKMDLMQRLPPARAELFGNERPTIVYVPHFRRALSSWDRFGRALIDWAAGQDRCNLIVAPHVRLFADASAAERAAVEALAVPGKLLIDLGSDRLFDMSYTNAADIYVGDVSSQVYEFLVRPRPCLFLDAHHADWRDNPDYRFWTLGDVVDDIAAFPAALDAAPARHALYAAAQRAAVAESVGGDPVGAAERGARAIIDFLLRDRADRSAAS
jgi:hypothetical protein